MLTRLPDGTSLLIRPIRPGDKPLLDGAVRRLSPESARGRFLTAKPSLNERELRYLTEVDGHDHCALVAVRVDDPSHLVAVARYVRLRDDPQTAEMAIVVADDYQGQGLGRRLGLELSNRAREDGVQRFLGLMLSDNVAAHRLFATISAALHTDRANGVDEVLVQLTAA